MKAESKPDALEQVRAARRQVSEQVGPEPEKLVAYYLELQRQYAARLVDSNERKSEGEAA